MQALRSCSVPCSLASADRSPRKTKRSVAVATKAAAFVDLQVFVIGFSLLINSFTQQRTGAKSSVAA
jgi:hypothetical protein